MQCRNVASGIDNHPDNKDVASGIDWHPDRTDIYFRVIESSRLVSVLFFPFLEKCLAVPIFTFHLLVNGFKLKVKDNYYELFISIVHANS